MVERPRAERPEILSLLFLNQQIIDAGVARRHQTLFIELPVFIAVRAKPVSGVVMPLIDETNGDPIIMKRPEFLDQPVVKLVRPFFLEKGNDLLASHDELGSVAPSALRAVTQGNLFGLREFHASSAARTFWIAVSSVKGGRGGRVSIVFITDSVLMEVTQQMHDGAPQTPQFGGGDRVEVQT
jgi:hypothetical protein